VEDLGIWEDNIRTNLKGNWVRKCGLNSSGLGGKVWTEFIWLRWVISRQSE
jgi:hypothetical protein